MIINKLNGENWTVSENGSMENIIPASVPGTIHEDLINNEKLDDPFYRDNEFKIRWIGEKSWRYKSEFKITKELIAHKNMILKCHGLDTLATVILNGKVLGKTDNMYRIWEFDLKEIAIKGTNTIEIVFDSVFPYIDKKVEENEEDKANTIHPALCLYRHRGYVRKMPSNFNWDWGPEMITCGIWKDIDVIAWNTATIEDTYIMQYHKDNRVELNCKIAVVSDSIENLFAKVAISFERKEIAIKQVDFNSKTENVIFEIDNPKIWWPAGMGEQPLYEIKFVLLDKRCNELDFKNMRIGLRTLELRREKDQWGESFEFVANGIPFFSKGSDWIPTDAVYSKANEKDYRRLLTDAKSANMNMIRVWAGGFYEHDYFYDICDELGLCVWQDFMFACSSYPIDNPDFRENVLAEIKDNVKRIRHHASLSLWCGSNELTFFWVGSDGWPQMPINLYNEFFGDEFQKVITENDPAMESSYWISSPTSSLNQSYPYQDEQTSGNAHIWGVWHKKEPFEFYRTCMHRFCSEFGFQSFPAPKTIEQFTLPEDRNITSKIMELHQRSASGNSTIMEYMLSWFKMPVGFNNTLWLSQIQQGLAIKYAVEHWRRNMDRCRGALYWQLNDCWPVASWSSIDYYGRWKALHYMAKNFFSPILLSILEDNDKQTMELHISSDLQEDKIGVIEWKICTTSGKDIETGTIPVKVTAGNSKNVSTLDFSKYDNIEKFIFFATLFVDGNSISENFASFVKPKHIELENPHIKSKITQSEPNNYNVILETDKPALWVWLEMEEQDIKISDNFFCMSLGLKKKISVKLENKLSINQFKQKLRINSIYDTYQEK